MSIDLPMDPMLDTVPNLSGGTGTFDPTIQMPPLDLTSYLANAMHWGADVSMLGQELVREVVAEAIAVQPRSLQREIGPSEIGVPCKRRLAYKFAEVAPTGLAAPKWAAAVGTAIHREFTEWCLAYNDRMGRVRFLPDLRVYVGDLYEGRPIFGTLDALDTVTGCVIDLKAPGPSQMRKYAPKHAPENPVYDVQVDLYAQGCFNAGYPVANVGIIRLPRSGELSQAGWKHRPVNLANGRAALARTGGVAKMVETMGVDAIPMFPAVEHYCTTCDWYRPGSTDLTTGCPGAAKTESGPIGLGLPSTRPASPPTHMTDLIA